MKWTPIEQASKQDPGPRGYLFWVPGWGPVGGGRWEDNRHAKTPRPYWTSDLEVLLGVNWQRQNQPTHIAEELIGPNGEVSARDVF